MYSKYQKKEDSYFWLIVHCVIAACVIGWFAMAWAFGSQFHEGDIGADQYFWGFIKGKGQPAMIFMVSFPFSIITHFMHKHTLSQRITLAAFVLFFLDEIFRLTA